jgi:sialidase-1
MIRTLIVLGMLLLTTEATKVGEPLPEKTDLFQANTGGYAHYCILGLVVTERGTLLAYSEARKSTRSDWGTIDILMRRSTDGGKTP